MTIVETFPPKNFAVTVALSYVEEDMHVAYVAYKIYL